MAKVNGKKRKANYEEEVMEIKNFIRSGCSNSTSTPGFENIKFNLKCKNKKQKEYSEMIKENNITICTGPAGTGKSYVALATAIELLRDSSTPYKKLVLMVAPVQTDVKVGFLKGDLGQKLDPFAYSYLYNMADMIGGIEKVNKLIETGYIEIMCVSFARGINLKNCICIVGESQQYSKESFLTIITRPSDTSKLIFEGDVYQCDNKNIRRKKETMGLEHARNCLKDIHGIDFIEFDKSEIVRNPIITRILTRWDPEVYGDESEYGLEKEE